MIRVGITGGIGSGKTTFCKVWEELGAFVLYADDFAKDLMVSDSEVIAQIKKTFGEGSYNTDGTLNRKYLADEAFANGRVQELNDIVHPALWEKAEELAAQKDKEGVEVFAKEAAILLQNGRPEDLDAVILLLADDDLRKERVIERDNTDADKVEDRMNKQQDFEELAHLCDYIVTNDGSIEDLKSKASDLYNLVNQIG